MERSGVRLGAGDWMSPAATIVARWHSVEPVGYPRDMTTTPSEPSPDPTVVPSGDPSPDSTLTRSPRKTPERPRHPRSTPRRPERRSRARAQSRIDDGDSLRGRSAVSPLQPATPRSRWPILAIRRVQTIVGDPAVCEGSPCGHGPRKLGLSVRLDAVE